MLATGLYWLIACLGSILWYLDSSKLNPFDLPISLFCGAVATLLGLFTVAISKRVAWSRMILFALSVAGGVVIYLRAGKWLDIANPKGLDWYDPFGRSGRGGVLF